MSAFSQKQTLDEETNCPVNIGILQATAHLLLRPCDGNSAPQMGAD
jgi:hypothetical protein